MGGKGEGVRGRLRGVWQWVCNLSQIVPCVSAAVLARVEDPGRPRRPDTLAWPSTPLEGRSTFNV